MFQQPMTTMPGFTLQQPFAQTQLPLAGQQRIINQGIPTSSIKYTTTQMAQPTVFNAQPMFGQQQIQGTISPSRHMINTVNTVQQPIMMASPIQTTQMVGTTIAQPTYSTSYTSQQVQLPAMATGMTSQVITGAGCPPPVQGQPIIIEGAVMGAQSYIEPVRQTVLLQGAAVRPELSQVMRGESRFEYVPYEQVVTEYDQLEKRIRVPINKYITEYQVIDHQIEYIPEISYQTQTDYIPQQRIEEEVQYSTQEKRIEHGIKQEMRTSQRIEGGAIATTTIAQPTTTIIESTVPAVQSYQTYQQTMPMQAMQTIQAAPVNVHSSRVYTTGPQIVNQQVYQTGSQMIAPQMQGIAYSQPQIATYASQIPVENCSFQLYSQVAQQWPTTWTNAQYGYVPQRKSSSE